MVYVKCGFLAFLSKPAILAAIPSALYDGLAQP